MMVPSRSELIARAVEDFEARFGCSPTVVASAPGRVNLLGEHTDYNLGLALPMAIDRHTVVAAAPAGDPAASTFVALDRDQSARANLSGQLRRTKPAWMNYILGVAHELRQFDAAPPSMQAVFTSSVPIGAGLSSSAALEVAFAAAMLELAGGVMERPELARLCQRAENDFVGMPCGLMDQLVSVCARAGSACRIDFNTIDIDHIELPGPDELTFLLADSGVKHTLANTEYARRREECAEVAAKLGVTSLREVTAETLLNARTSLTDVGFRRAWHVVGENVRVQLAVEAIEAGDLEGFGRLMHQSHVSLRDQYEVSCPELDTLVDIASSFDAEGDPIRVFGSRMTGGGFGGCTITACRPDAAEQLEAHLTRSYHERCGRTPVIHEVHAGAGAMIVDPEPLEDA
jgi:galactokinase